MKRYVVGITGASGSIYGKRVVEALIAEGCAVELVITKMGEDVWAYELDGSFQSWIESLPKGVVTLHRRENLFAPIASGSYKVESMVVVPCSMGTLGRIANGVGGNLLCRAADVALKEERKLVLVVRETPLSLIHLENCITLKRAGATILPPLPAMYKKPTTIEELVDTTVGRILYTLGIESTLHHAWGSYE